MRLSTLRQYGSNIGGSGIHYKDRSTPVDIIDCTSATGWSVTTANGAVSVAAATLPGGTSQNVVVGARSSAVGTFTLLASVDTAFQIGQAAGHYELMVYIDSIPQHSTAAGPDPDVAVGGISSNHLVLNIKFRDTADNNGLSPASSYRLRKGWNRVIIPHGDFTTFGSATFTTFAPDQVQFNFAAITGLSYTVKIAWIRHCVYRRPVVINIFDDCRIGVQNIALPFMAARGLKATLAVVGQLLTGENRQPGGSSITAGANFMTLAQIQAAHNTYGWDCANHTYTHFGQMHGYSAANFQTELVDCRTAMQNAGLVRNNLHKRAFMHVGGGASITMFGVLEDNGYICAGKVAADSTPVIRDSHHMIHRYLRERFDTGTHEFNGGGGAKLATASDGPIQAVKDAVDRGAPVILMWHNIVAGASTSTIENSTAYLKLTMDYLYANNGILFDVLTLGEYLNLLTAEDIFGVDSVRVA